MALTTSGADPAPPVPDLTPAVAVDLARAGRDQGVEFMITAGGRDAGIPAPPVPDLTPAVAVDLARAWCGPAMTRVLSS